MNVVYACQDLPERDGAVVPNSIFLAGPTPRADDVRSWRPDAIAFLAEQEFDGHVFIPETDGGGWHGNYDEQVEWEWDALGRAACVLFWIPRKLDTMPGFTTNVEYGLMAALAPERVVLGAPDSAPKLRYIRTMASKVWRFHDAFDPGIKKVPSIHHGNTLKKALLLAILVACPNDRPRRT